MVDDKAHGTIGKLLELCADYEETAEEAEAELRAMGVDVDAFLERVRKRIQDAKADAMKAQAEDAVSTAGRLSEAGKRLSKSLMDRKIPHVTSIGVRLTPVPTIIVYLKTRAALTTFRREVPEVGTGFLGFHVTGMVSGSARPAKG